MVVVKGSGVLASDQGDYRLAAGQVWLLPAAMAPGRCRPASTLAVLLSTLPDSATTHP
jgi:hypothetical protein